MGSRAILAHAPILLPHISCGYDRNALPMSPSIAAKERPGVPQLPFRDSHRTDIQHARRPRANFHHGSFAYKLDPKRATALLEAWFEATSDLPNEAFSAWIMNAREVTVVVITIRSREQKGLVTF